MKFMTYTSFYSNLGIPSLIHGHMVKEGAIIIDVGISRIVDPVSGKSKVIGDVNFEGNNCYCFQFVLIYYLYLYFVYVYFRSK